MKYNNYKAYYSLMAKHVQNYKQWVITDYCISGHSAQPKVPPEIQQSITTRDCNPKIPNPGRFR